MNVKLLIISNMAHYRRNGRIVGWGPAVQEIDQLATMFDDVRHVACLHEDEAPPTALPYGSEWVSVVGVPASGGDSALSKLRVLWMTPRYVRTMWREIATADCIHVRCPANISLLAIALLALIRSRGIRWVKYAGNWQAHRGEAWSYAFQRWWLTRGFHRGLVTVNGEWPGQPDHVRSFLNPCLTAEELEEGRRAAAEKSLTFPIRLLFVGRLEAAKGCGRVLDILSRVRELGIPACLDVVGDGPNRNEFEARAAALRADGSVHFLGLLPRPSLPAVYAASHILVFPSCSEGWPKVLSEGMAFGVVPVASAVGSIPQYLKAFRTGKALAANDVEGFAQAIAWYCQNPEQWKTESVCAVKAAADFGYTRYLTEVRRLLQMAD
ncbi:MAG: glycosyltransferase [Thermoanaerobaculia bacterium]